MLGGLIEIGRRYGGDVLKFRGDALLLLFDGDLHEERAARAALAMQAFVTESASGESSVGPVRLGWRPASCRDLSLLPGRTPITAS